MSASFDVKNIRILDSISPPSFLTSDGHTVAWYDFAKDVTTSGTDVTEWGDQSGNGHDLITLNGTPQLGATGITFSSARAQASFALDHPVTMYLVVKMITWIDDGMFTDGVTAYSMPLCSGYGGTPTIALLAWESTSTNLAVGAWGIVIVTWGGASTNSLYVDDHAARTTDADFPDPEGVTLGSTGHALFRTGHVEYKEVIFRDITDSSDDRASVYTYLNTKYSLGL